MDIAAIKERLKAGNHRFVQDKLDGKLQDSQRRSSLTSGQEPYAIILSCSDSRVVPELIFDTGLGELFVIRVAGNIANPSSIASIEYAVAHCGAKVIVVMGHESCGAVTAASKGGDLGEHLNHLIHHITPSLLGAKPGADINDMVKLHAKLMAETLYNRSKIISNAVDTESVEIIPAYYNLESGIIDYL